MKFEYFRFLLTPVTEPQLPLDKQLSKNDLIQQIFSEGKNYKFKSGKATYGFVVKHKSDDIVQARIGKLTTKKLYSSPDLGFAVKNAEDWPGSDAFINLSDEQTTGRTRKAGQIIACAVNKAAITNSVHCMRALADLISQEILRYGFHFSINPILTERRSFWAVADEHKGHIRKVVLIYTPPNLFNLKNKLEDDLREANKTFNTTSAQIIFENDTGHLELPKDNPLLKQSAEYIDLGNGSYAFHLKDGKTVVRSEDGVRVETFLGTEVSIEGVTAQGVKDLIGTILGKTDV